MRICWYNDNRLGVVKGGTVYDATRLLEKLPKPTYPASRGGDPLIANLAKRRPDLEAAATGSGIPVAQVKFLSPVAAPSKVIGTPTNYTDHIAEANQQRAVFTGRYSGTIEEQGLFLKANSCLIGAGETVKLRFPARRTITRWSSASSSASPPPTSSSRMRSTTSPAIASRSTWWCAARRTVRCANRSTLTASPALGW